MSAVAMFVAALCFRAAQEERANGEAFPALIYYLAAGICVVTAIRELVT